MPIFRWIVYSAPADCWQKKLGKLYLFVAIDRTLKFTYAELLEKYTKMEAAHFLRNLITAIPYRIYTARQRHTIYKSQEGPWAFTHIFDWVCHERHVEHRLTKVNHSWTNGLESV